ncbi:MAG: PH domain-containing protein [Candidatus Kerfeldbacteria bacterium]|nr:PH domain-containing protein [Candidatus Kerfeldbacteria bacterium]
MKDWSNYYLPGLSADERVDQVLRRHKVALGSRIFMFLIGGILPVVIVFLLYRFTILLDDQASLAYLLLVLLGSIFYLYITLFIYHAWVDYYLDVWFITNKRIIATEQHGLFHRTTSELLLNQIQDVSSETKGFLPTIFRYGSISVQTASEQDRFMFADVPNADLVAKHILDLHNAYQPAASITTPGAAQPTSNAQTLPPTPPGTV